MMDLVIKIPEKEFGIDINDKFQDFFQRLKAETKAHLLNDTALVCGAYELETIEMFLNAFASAIIVPKGHGRLGDLDELEQRISNFVEHDAKITDGYTVARQRFIVDGIRQTQAIIEADKESEK